MFIIYTDILQKQRPRNLYPLVNANELKYAYIQIECRYY